MYDNIIKYINLRGGLVMNRDFQKSANGYVLILLTVLLLLATSTTFMVNNVPILTKLLMISAWVVVGGCYFWYFKNPHAKYISYVLAILTIAVNIMTNIKATNF